MSLPHFPEEALDITCGQAFNMLLGSIAMEELALSHIMNAEGEKLQYMLGTLPGKPRPCATPKEILEVNRSISDLLEKVSYQQILLKGKLQQVLEAKHLCTTPEPPCPQPTARMCAWSAEQNSLWSCGQPIAWKRDWEKGKRICWQKCVPASLYLCPETAVFLCFSFRLRVNGSGAVRVSLCKNQGCCEVIQTCECCTHRTDGIAIASGCTMLAENCGKTTAWPIQFVLETPECVCVEQAKLTILSVDTLAVV